MVNLKDIASKGLIEKRLIRFLNEDSKIIKINARDLITPNRFDICFKLAYLDIKEKNPVFAKDIYSAHIKAFGLGEYTEPEKPNKNNLEIFINEFESIYKNMEKYGFDSNASIIPISKDGSILNGSHRVACAIKLGIDVVCVQLNVSPSEYDYNFFKNRLVPWEALLLSVESLQLYKSNIHTAIIWPIAKSKTLEILKKNIRNIYIHETYKLSIKEGAGLVRQVYQGEKWLGTSYNNYKGAYDKAIFCWGEKSNQLDMVIFEREEDALILKEKIRAELGLGKHCIHISDYDRDSAMIWRSLLNNNFHSFLKNEIFLKSMDKDLKLKTLQKELEEIKIISESFCVVGSMVLEILGVREARDVDLMIDIESISAIGENKLFDFDNSKLEVIGLSAQMVVHNPRNYFYYNSVKVLSIENIYLYKVERYKTYQERKDKIDIDMMDYTLGSRSLIDMKIFYGKIFIAKEKYKRKFKKNLKIFLSKVGLFEFVKKMLR